MRIRRGNLNQKSRSMARRRRRFWTSRRYRCNWWGDWLKRYRRLRTCRWGSRGRSRGVGAERGSTGSTSRYPLFRKFNVIGVRLDPDESPAELLANDSGGS